MFDLITESLERPLRERSVRSKIVSVGGHMAVLFVVFVLLPLSLSDALPQVPPVMMAFVAAAPPAPPPPPAPVRAPRATARAARPEPTLGQFTAPIQAPSGVHPEPAVPSAQALAGVEGGVEGGVPGGIVGGIVGGISPPPPPPPAPPLPPERAAPVRIGGNISAPQLTRRVEPEYPALAAAARVEGIVILEALVDAQGCVESIKVLRSVHRLLDKAAMDALVQWQYSPLILNGKPVSFLLTVTFKFTAQS